MPSTDGSITSMSRFEYLPGLIPVLLVEVFLLTIFSVYPIVCQQARGPLEKPLLVLQDNRHCALRDLLPPIPFANSYQSANRSLTRLLLFTRLGCVAVFVGLGVGLNSVLDDGNFDVKFFTNWNVLLVSLYFVGASFASILGSQRVEEEGEEEKEEKESYSRLSVTLHVLFEVAGGAAFMITVVNFSLLDSNVGDLENTVCHLATSCSLILESGLNRFEVRRVHFPFVLLWALVYICVIWTCVARGVVRDWPYLFLATDSPACFLWYSGLLGAAVCFYYTFYMLNRLKFWVHLQIQARERFFEQAACEQTSLQFLDDAVSSSKATQLA